MIMLCSVAPRFRRPTTTRNCSISAARPASSGGREPAFGVYGFAIGSKGYRVIHGYKRSRYMPVEVVRSYGRGIRAPSGVTTRRRASAVLRARSPARCSRRRSPDTLPEAGDPVLDLPAVVVIVNRPREHVDHLHDVR